MIVLCQELESLQQDSASRKEDGLLRRAYAKNTIFFKKILITGLRTPIWSVIHVLIHLVTRLLVIKINLRLISIAPLQIVEMVRWPC
jgi:hypothetical protein